MLLPVGFSVCCCAVSVREPTCAVGATSEYVPDDTNLVTWAAIVIKHASIALSNYVLWISVDFGSFWKRRRVRMCYVMDASLTIGASSVVIITNFVTMSLYQV